VSLAIFAVVLTFAVPAVPAASVQTRTGRCNVLQSQLSDEVNEHAGSRSSATAAAMGVKAKRLCASGKQAQGLRLYAKALQLLGVQPIEPK
jgi:hypothetical protein